LFASRNEDGTTEGTEATEKATARRLNRLAVK
jgi:hypothetical protein